jgi:hypothetical protein
MVRWTPEELSKEIAQAWNRSYWRAMVRVRDEAESLISRQGGETNVLDWATRREVVRSLPVAR